MRRFSTSVVASCVVVVVVGPDHFSTEVEIELSLVRWEKVGGWRRGGRGAVSRLTGVIRGQFKGGVV